MLVLTRKNGETIHIGEDIVIQVLQVQGRQVRIGIEAPKQKKIQRGELFTKRDLKQVLLSKENCSIKTL